MIYRATIRSESTGVPEVTYEFSFYSSKDESLWPPMIYSIMLQDWSRITGHRWALMPQREEGGALRVENPRDNAGACWFIFAPVGE